ncbi:MAG: hypothetical protein EOP83_05755 [Verrucomicrobiaceae bacterium]|nr:MAG: hypothetical protein EOP83_05755 [Verrucomicrobiaceae bacterium]
MIYEHFNEHYPYQVVAPSRIKIAPQTTMRIRVLKQKPDYRDDEELTALLDWCAEQFGKSDYFGVNAKRIPAQPGDKNRCFIRAGTRKRWNHLGLTFYFKTQEDATLFKVFWG